MDIRITVADVIYPAAGKKQGKIVDQTGKEWYVWGDKMAGYSRGGSYIINKYKTSDFKGRTYYTIEDVMPASGGTVSSQPQSRPVPETPIKLQMAPPVSDHERRMDIFICGAFNNLMANPNVNPAMLQAADMIEFVKRFKATWLSTLSGPPKPGDDMNDSLPEGF